MATRAGRGLDGKAVMSLALGDTTIADAILERVMQVHQAFRLTGKSLRQQSKY